MSRKGLATASWAGTVVFSVSSALAVAFEGFRPIAVAIDLALFTAGTVAFLWAYAIAVTRSRTDEIGIGGLYFLAGDTAPKQVRRTFAASLAVQVVVALVAASLALYTSVAFGILAPVYGLGLMGLWGARHGSFQPRGRVG